MKKRKKLLNLIIDTWDNKIIESLAKNINTRYTKRLKQGL